jgi:hypothetical protein
MQQGIRSMSTEFSGQDDSAEREAEKQSDAMKTQLRKDVASWSEARGETSLRPADMAITSVAKPAPPQPVVRTKKAKPAQPAIAPTQARTKPFSMSYDGGSMADYIQYMIDRGAR